MIVSPTLSCRRNEIRLQGQEDRNVLATRLVRKIMTALLFRRVRLPSPPPTCRQCRWRTPASLGVLDQHMFGSAPIPVCHRASYSGTIHNYVLLEDTLKVGFRITIYSKYITQRFGEQRRSRPLASIKSPKRLPRSTCISAPGSRR